MINQDTQISEAVKNPDIQGSYFLKAQMAIQFLKNTCCYCHEVDPFFIDLSKKKGVFLMEIPISGFMYENNNSDSSHSHHLFITSWDGRQTHIHGFQGVTSFDAEHDHRYAGRTEPAPSGVQHTHRYFTFTSVDDRHRHQIRGVTGPAVFLPGGGHYHEFRGTTTVDGPMPHRHRYSGRTSLQLPFWLTIYYSEFLCYRGKNISLSP